MCVFICAHTNAHTHIVLTGWKVRGSNPSGGEIFRTRPDRPWGPLSLLYDGYRVSFPGVKRPGRGVNHPPPSSAEVKERVQLYLYFPSGLPWTVPGRTLPFTLYIYCAPPSSGGPKANAALALPFTRLILKSPIILH